MHNPLIRAIMSIHLLSTMRVLLGHTNLPIAPHPFEIWST